MPTKKVVVEKTMRWTGDICGVKSQEKDTEWNLCDFCHEDQAGEEYCCHKYGDDPAASHEWPSPVMWLAVECGDDDDDIPLPQRCDQCKRENT